MTEEPFPDSQHQTDAITFSAVLQRAEDKADRREAEIGVTGTPALDRAAMHLHHAFEAAIRIACAADTQTPLSPIALADYFAELRTHLKRANALADSGAFKAWVSDPGRSFAQFFGNSAREVVHDFLKTVHSSLFYTFGYSTLHGQYTPEVLALILTGDEGDPQIATWPERGLTELRTKSLAPEQRWKRIRDSGALWSHFLDELRRTREFIVHLESLDWYSLAVFGSQAATNWVDDPAYRDQVRTLSSRLRSAVRAAGICDQNADDFRAYQNVLDWLVADAGFTVSKADLLPVADI